MKKKPVDTIEVLVQNLKFFEEENKRLNVLAEGAKKLLKIYDALDDGEYLIFLDSFVLAVEKRFDKKFSKNERLAFRHNMKDFIESTVEEIQQE